MKKWIMKWYEFMPYVAGCYALILAFGHWSFQGKILLASIICIHLHFYEEFGLPGGFAWGGIKVEMKKVSPDVSKWPLNQASALFGNEWFAIVVYLLALLCPQWRWTILAVFLFAYLEFLMHWVIFNIGLRTWYNPGAWTAVILTILSIIYLCNYVPTERFSWPDVIISLLWVGLNYWIGFRSPLFKYFNNKQKYTFTQDDLEKSRPYMAKFGRKPDDYQYY